MKRGGGKPPALLEDATWKQISEASISGKIPETWKIGSTKSFIFEDRTYTAQIIGFAHDDLTAGGKAGITFQMRGLLAKKYKMNNRPTNSGSWEGCTLRTNTLPAILSGLPVDMRDVIAAVNKTTAKGAGSSKIIVTSDKLWIPSTVEVFGKRGDSAAGEGAQYEWFKTNSKVKDSEAWSTRSPHRSYSQFFCNVSAEGTTDYIVANIGQGLSLAFCV